MRLLIVCAMKCTNQKNECRRRSCALGIRSSGLKNLDSRICACVRRRIQEFIQHTTIRSFRQHGEKFRSRRSSSNMNISCNVQLLQQTTLSQTNFRFRRRVNPRYQSQIKKSSTENKNTHDRAVRRGESAHCKHFFGSFVSSFARPYHAHIAAASDCVPIATPGFWSIILPTAFR